MKKYILSIFILLVSGLTFGQTNTTPRTQSVEIDGYAARVNDRIITQGEVWQALAPKMAELHRSYQGERLKEELEKSWKITLDKLIEQALILESFKMRGGNIPDQYVNSEIQRIIKNNYKNDKALFEQELTRQKKTRAEYMNILRDQIAVSMMINEEVTRRARTTPAQIRAAYENKKEQYFIPEKVRYSVILLNKGKTEEDRAVKQHEAESILEKLNSGADFNELAKELSEGSRAKEGGQFPWMQPKDARPELKKILQTLPAGNISEIIETENELLIVKIDARKQASYKSFDEVRKIIKTSLTEKERARLMERWIKLLKENNYVIIY